MKVILHNGNMVAFAHGERIKLDPDLDVLALDHPDRRWAMALATFACLVEIGDQPGPYTPDHAAEFARDILLPIPPVRLPCSFQRPSDRRGLQGARRPGPSPAGRVGSQPQQGP